MSTNLNPERLRTILQNLCALTEHRAQTQERIETTYREGSETSKLQYTQEREQLDSEHEQAMRKANSDFRRTGRSLKKQSAEELQRLELEQASHLGTIEEKAQHNVQTAGKMRDEVIWTAETVFEAREPHLAQQYEQACSELDGRLNDLEKEQERAAAVLKRSWMRLPVMSVKAAGETHGDDLSPYEDSSGQAVDELSGLLALRILRGGLPIMLTLVIVAAAGVVGAWRSGWIFDQAALLVTGSAMAAVVVLLGIVFLCARVQVRPPLTNLARAIALGQRAHEKARAELAADRQRELQQLSTDRELEVKKAHSGFKTVTTEVEQRRGKHLKRVQDTYPNLLTQAKQRHAQELQETEAEHQQLTQSLEKRYEKSSTALESGHAADRQTQESAYAAGWTELVQTWNEDMTSLTDELADITNTVAAGFPSFNDDSWKDWVPSAQPVASVAPFGHLKLDMESLPGGLPDDERLPLPGPHSYDVPALLTFPNQGSLLLQSGADGHDEAVSTLENVMLRMLTSLPPGKARFIIIDPIGLGRRFAGFMHLTDYEEGLIGSKIWTEARHIEQRLTDLTEHMENVIQKYLRNEFETIDQYNEHAGEIAEPYRFLVISDLPAHFSDNAARRLKSVVNSGARCGVYSLIHVDTRHDLPGGLSLSDLEQGATTLVYEKSGFKWKDEIFGKLPLSLEQPPSDEFITEQLHRVGEAAKHSSRVEVPFATISPPPEKRWTAKTDETVEVALGRAGATKLQNLLMGPGTSQHALIAGKTGSGKSTLLHVLITNLALWYDPRQIEVYLVDFKKGVEFKTYATHNLPHARAVAVESDREFGISVLQRLDAELRRRGERYRDEGVQDLAGFRRKVPDEPMPRTLLIIDEFQEFFVEDDKLAQDAALLLDRLVRQGRAFGIHVLLGSQTLAGAYTLARATIGQMAVRVALQCSEADSYLILSDDNAAARLLARPGQAIYNDANGLVEGNNPFQICWLPEEERDERLADVAALAKQHGFVRSEPQIVFEGNAPAVLSRNHLIEALLAENTWPQRPRAAHAWLGDAVAIKDPTSASFRRQSGSNLLMTGQRDEAALAMVSAALIGLATQHAPGDAMFYLLDGTAPDSPHADFLSRLAGEGDATPICPHHIERIPWRQVPDTMAQIETELHQREGEGGESVDAPSIYLIIYGLQRFRMLRQSDDFSFSMDEDKPQSPDKQFMTILRDGPPVGLHTLVWCDTLNNVNRAFDRQGLWEFDMRVVFQMSAADSSHLIDSPQAGQLGLRRALFYSEEQGLLEKFRPYGLPEESWLDEVRQRFAAKTVGTS
jgi:hypothetical protein